MTQSRRLPLVVALLAAALCAPSLNAGRLVMEPVPVPRTDAEKRAVLSSSKAKVNGTGVDTGLRPLLRSGDRLPRLLDGHRVSADETIAFGTLFGSDGAPLQEAGEPMVSDRTDFNSLILAGGHLYLISHFESRPGAMYQTLLGQAEDGDLKALATRPIDFSAVRGGWVHCAGSVTPWGSHLGSEEYEPDARQWSDPALPISPFNARMSRYFPGGDGSPASAAALLNPYDYGWPTEVALAADGTPHVAKRYAMGRSANELAFVMPDRRTVYITDDGNNTMLLLFIADQEGDLGTGTLYAARWAQTSDAGLGSARIEWVSLGHAAETDIAAAIAGGGADGGPIRFDDLLVYAAPNADGTCPPATDTTPINTGHGAPYLECIRMTADTARARTLASRLETRRYAALRGATTEFNKMEGITYDPDRRTLYLSMSDLGKGMRDKDPRYDLGGPNQVRLAPNRCGGVYALALGSGARDIDGNSIDSAYVAGAMKGLVSGTPVAGEVIDGERQNACALDGISNPDNLSYLPGYGVLLIAEDTPFHQNDALWAYDTAGGALTRVLTTPYGAESTSPYWYPDIGGFGYLMSVVQHPYGESDQSKSWGREDERGYVGYFKLPALR
jgi:secreted PhoX family phosphatase